MSAQFRSRRYRPTVETLEGRWVPAVVVTTLDLDSDGNVDDLRIVGDANNNSIVISDVSNAVLLDVDKNGDGDFTDPGELLDDNHAVADGTIVIDLHLSDGNDTIFCEINNVLSQDRRLYSVDLGAGSDSFTFESSAGLIDSSELILDILAGQGGDSVQVDLLSALDSLIAIQCLMGGGVDDVDLSMNGAINSSSTLDIDVDLGGGSNTAAVAIDTVGGVGQGFVDVNVTGSNSATQIDDVILRLTDNVGDGSVVSSLSVDVDLLAGNDICDVVLFPTTFDVATLSMVDLSIQGGAGKDTLGIDAIGTGEINLDTNGILELEMKGGLGNDIITVDLSDPTGLNLDGRFRLRIEGNEGNDTITVNIQYIVTSLGNLDIAIYANAGNDTVTYDLEDNGSPATFGPAGVAILDGGLGSDTLDDNSDPAQSDHHLFEVFI